MTENTQLNIKKEQVLPSNTIIEKTVLVPGPSTDAGTKRYYYRDPKGDVHLVTPDYAKMNSWKPAEKKEVEKQVAQKDSDAPAEFTSPNFQGTITRFTAALKRDMPKKIIASSDEERNNIIKYMGYFTDGVAKLIDKNVSKQEKQKVAQQLAGKYKLSVNEPIPNPKGKLKLYVGEYVGKQNRKLLGNPSSTLYKIASLIKHYGGEIPTRTVGGTPEAMARIKFAALAKPSFSSDSIGSYDKSEYVANIFKPFSGIQNNTYKHIYGLVEGGKFIPANTPENIRKTYEWSLKNNQALQKLKSFTKKLNTPVYKAIYKSLEEHEQMLHSAAKKFPSPEAVKQVNAAYSKLVTDFMTLDPDVAGSAVKNIAETALYHLMLADGKEVYMPVAGNFPVGDLIHVQSSDAKKKSKVVRVSFISVKAGKSGSGENAVYGFPGQASSFQMYHPNAKKQNMIGIYLSQPNHTLLVRDEIIKNNLIPDLIKEAKIPLEPGKVQLLKTLATKTLAAVEPVVQKAMKKHGVGYQKHIEADLRKVMAPFDNVLKQKFSQEDLAKVLGEANAKRLWNQTGVAQFLSAVVTRNMIETANGFEHVLHNKQDYEKGKYVVSSNLQGTRDMNKWYIDYRMYATASRNGAGIMMSYTGGNQGATHEGYDVMKIIFNAINEVV